MADNSEPSSPKATSKQKWPYVRWMEDRQRWLVDSRTATGGKRRFFETRAEAEGAAQKARIHKKNEGGSAFDDRQLKKYGWSVQQAIRFAVEHLERQQGSVPVSEAITLLEASKLASGKTQYYCTLMRQRLEKMLPTFGSRKIGEITSAEIETFLNSLDVAATTRNTVRRDMVTLWSYAVKTRRASSNEAKKVDIAETAEAPPGILTIPQAAALLANSQDGDILAFHAIGLFAGLRVAEIKRLDWKDVDLEGGYVHVSAANSKTRTRRLIPVLPALSAWLGSIARKSGTIILPNFAKRQKAARLEAGISEWPQNGLRHSFVTYRLADTGNAAQTALESGHDEEVMFAHYREIVKPAEAKRYFALRPS